MNNKFENHLAEKCIPNEFILELKATVFWYFTEFRL